MNESRILNAQGDPMGAAIYDYHVNGKAGVLKVFSSMFEDDEIPVADLFRTKEEMPCLEQKALELALEQQMILLVCNKHQQHISY